MKTHLYLCHKTASALAATLLFAAGLQAQSNSPVVLPAVSVIASDPTALEGTSSGAFTLLRYGPTNAAVMVSVSFSGSASNGVDYGPVSNTLTIPAGNLSLDIPIVPLIDTVNRGNKTVILTVATNPAYGVSRSSATVEIIDDVYNIPPPGVVMTSPADGSTYLNPATITLTAMVTDPGVTVTSVSFYENDSFLGSVSNSPYSLVWSNVTSGHYALFARAVDDVDHSAVSAPVHVTVTNPVPVVTIISPTNGSKFVAGANITFAATATETGGTIASVAFYDGSHLLGTESNSPYMVTWTNVPKGTYELYAVATDTAGNKGYASVAIAVTNPMPSVTITAPTNGSAFLAGANINIAATATETGGTISNVAFYAGSHFLGSLSSSPYSVTWSNAPKGSFELTAVATDTAGNKGYASVNILVTNPVPTVTITSPTNNSSFPAGANITVTATATETGGTIKSVTFYEFNHSLGTVTKSPYSVTWTNVPAGNYDVYAVALDTLGQTADAGVNITVSNAPPPVAAVVKH